MINTEKEEWFLWVDNKKLGPFSKQQLKKYPDFTPDTLVWKKGFQDWVLARYVEELKDLFEDQTEASQPNPFKKKEEEWIESVDSEITLDLEEPPYFFIWILIMLLLLIFTLMRLN